MKAEAEASHPDYLEGNQDWTNPLNRDKRARIIVRNLPFANLSDDTVRKIFSDYGNIIDVRLLKKPDGKYVGCGFVEFDQKQSAAKAIVHANGKEISGWLLALRKIVISIHCIILAVYQIMAE